MRVWTVFLLAAQGFSLGAEWKAARKMPAPEAHQAAAADKDFVYAITSRAVAKYDRKTGQRVAVSTGAARHLNSDEISVRDRLAKR